MASGYRLVVRDVLDAPLPRKVNRGPVTDYEGLGDAIVTEPNAGTVTDAAGYVVTTNKRTACFKSDFVYPIVSGTPRVSVLEVSWDEGDVIASKGDNHKVTSIDVGDELTVEEIHAASNGAP
jgi:hypothetical protein